MTVVFVIFGGILLGSYFIKYPDTMQSPVVLTTYSRYDGLIYTLSVADGEQVEQGTPVAVLRSAADRSDVQRVEAHLVQSEGLTGADLCTADWLSAQYRLGELQAAYADFQSKCRDYRHYLDADNIGHKKQLIAQQIAKNREYYAKLERQRALLIQDLDYGRRTLERDSLLLSEAVISSADYEATAQN